MPAAQLPRATDYDAIVVGSGMGGLSVASLLAQLRGKRVLVVERHFKLGGFTHAFRRGPYHFDVGLHYVGRMGAHDQLGQLMHLVTGGRVRWSRMPERFERFIFPDFSFDQHAGRERLREDLIGAFPAERAAIDRYLRDVSRCAAAFQCWVMRRNGSAILRLLGSMGGWFLPTRWEQSTKAYLDAHVRSPQLKAVLAAQWGDYGLPPAQSPFTLHSLIAQHYFAGAYYPQGGAGGIAAAVKQIVEAAGGATLVGHEATEILVRGGRAVGVKLRKAPGCQKNGDLATIDFLAPVVVSAIGAAATYSRLVPAGVPIAFRQDLKQFVARRAASSDVTLYVGFAEHPGRLGFQGENHWLFAGLDHDALYAGRNDWLDGGTPPSLYLSFPSLKDPDAKAHTADLIAWADCDRFAAWRDQPWRNRGPEYERFKERLAETLLSTVERRYPGFSALVTFQELSTPLSSEHFTGHARGAIYGLPAVAERFRPGNLAWHHPCTPLPGLYLTGVDVASLGIAGALIGGVTTLSHLPGGVSTPAVLRAARLAAAGSSGD